MVYLKEKQEVQCSKQRTEKQEKFQPVCGTLHLAVFFFVITYYPFQQIGHFWLSLLLWKDKPESCKYFLNTSPINLFLFIFTPSCSHPSPKPHHLLPEIRLWVLTDLRPPFLAESIQFPCSIKEQVFLIQIESCLLLS